MPDAYCPALNDDQHDDLRDWCPPTPPYWRDKSLYGLLEEIWQWPEDIADGRCALTTAEEIEACFNKLADEWEQETQAISSIPVMISHPNYRKIIKLGWEVLPFLLRDLQTNRRFWFPALYEITRIRPFDRSDAGDSERMLEAWVKWGKRKQLI